MNRHRLRFSKTDVAVYISHLDTMRTFQRAFLRAGIRVKHTEGFNPHAFISIAIPLSVGQESNCELLDFELAGADVKPEQVPGLLNQVLPEGIVVKDCYENGRSLKELAFLSCRGTLSFDDKIPDGCMAALERLYSAKELVITKKSKKGPVETDIRPMIRSLMLEQEGDSQIKIEAVVSAQNPFLNPDYLVAAIRQKLPEYAPDFAQSLRLELHDRNMELFF